MTAQRSKAEVNAMLDRAQEKRKELLRLFSVFGTPDRWPYGPELAAFDALTDAYREYCRMITYERAYNALRNAVKQAESVIDKHNALIKEAES